MKYITMDWNGFYEEANKVSNYLREKHQMQYFDSVCIMRGGYYLGTHIHLSLPKSNNLGFLEVYRDKNKDNEIAGFHLDGIRGAHRFAFPVVLIDDINDSGKTLTAAKEWLEAHGANVIESVTIHNHYSSIFTTTFSPVEVEDDTWIVYPWEDDNIKKLEEMNGQDKTE